MEKRRRIPVGTPGHLTPAQYMLIFGVPVIAVVALLIGATLDGRAEARRDQKSADAVVEAFITETRAQSGQGALARDQSETWKCDEARTRANGDEPSVEPYKSMSRDLAMRFVRELC
jgi:hypothetical protein